MGRGQHSFGDEVCKGGMAPALQEMRRVKWLCFAKGELGFGRGANLDGDRRDSPPTSARSIQ